MMDTFKPGAAIPPDYDPDSVPKDLFSSQPNTDATAVTREDARTQMPNGYAAPIHGQVMVNGNAYDFVSGGRGRGALPFGDYAVGGAETHPFLGGTAYPLSDSYDPYTGDNRVGLFIHRGRGASEGCIAIPPEQWDSFQKDMTAAGPKSIHVGPNQADSSTVTPFLDQHPQGIDRSRFAAELANTPGLKERLLGISAGENDDPTANLAVMETAMNRADMLGTSLARQLGLSKDGGYYAGYKPSALNDPAMRFMMERNLAQALSGSNVSNYATDNASGPFARLRAAVGMYTPNSSYGGEYFSHPSRSDASGYAQYPGWRDRADAGGPQSSADKFTQALTAGGRMPYTNGPESTDQTEAYGNGPLQRLASALAGAPRALLGGGGNNNQGDGNGPIQSLASALAGVPRSLLGGGGGNSQGGSQNYPDPSQLEMGKALLSDALAGTNAPGMGTTIGKLAMLLAGNKMTGDYAAAQQQQNANMFADQSAPQTSGGTGGIGGANNANASNAESIGGNKPTGFIPPTHNIESIYPMRTIRTLAMNPATYAQAMQLWQERQKALTPTMQTLPSGKTVAGTIYTGWVPTQLPGKPQIEKFQTKVGDLTVDQPKTYNVDENGKPYFEDVPVRRPGEQPQAAPQLAPQNVPGTTQTQPPARSTSTPATGGEAVDEMPVGGTPGQLAEWELHHKAREAGEKTTAEELSKAKAIPVAEAIKEGASATKANQAVMTLGAINNLPGSDQVNSGPWAEHWLDAKKALLDLTGIDLGGIAPAEGITKMNAFLSSQAAREMTNRPTQFDFKTFLDNNPGIALSPEGRAMMIDIIMQSSKQDMELSKLATKVKNPEDWPDIREQYLEKHPIIVHYHGNAINSSDPLNNNPIGNPTTPNAAPSYSPGDIAAEMKRRRLLK